MAGNSSLKRELDAAIARAEHDLAGGRRKRKKRGGTKKRRRKHARRDPAPKKRRRRARRAAPKKRAHRRRKAVHSRKTGRFVSRRRARDTRNGRDPDTYVAYEFDLLRGERTGKTMEFSANSMKEAGEHLAYTLNLKSAGWRVSPSGKTVGKKTGDIGWHIVREGTFASRMMGGRDPRRYAHHRDPGPKRRRRKKSSKKRVHHSKKTGRFVSFHHSPKTGRFRDPARPKKRRGTRKRSHRGAVTRRALRYFR